MRVCIIIPTLCEEEGIAKTIKSIPKYYDIFVVDGNSKDNTVPIAKSLNAKVITCKEFGKGNALRKAIRMLDYDAYVFIDGDGSYNGKYIPSLLRYLKNGYDVVLGSRFMRKTKMSLFRLISNKILTSTFNLLNHSNLTDVVTGLRAISRKFVKNVKLKEEDFKIETEITLKAVRLGYKIIEVPIYYQKRLGKSKMRLTDMLKIFFFCIKESLKNSKIFNSFL
jgi:glycosyltransferase involved in cell wall biosynthesis